MKKKATKSAAGKPAKAKAKTIWPPFGGVQTQQLSTMAGEPRFRFRWVNSAGRKRQWTISLVSPKTAREVERLILSEARRDTSKPQPRRARA